MGNIQIAMVVGAVAEVMEGKAGQAVHRPTSSSIGTTSPEQPFATSCRVFPQLAKV
jgi:hypothetical protein